VINKIEVSGYPSVDNKLTKFINSANILNLDTNITERTIELRINHSIKIPDAIIAATALKYKLILLTRNTTEFKQIPKLRSENPWQW